MITTGRALAIAAKALRHPRASRAAIDDFQSRALVRLVAHAYAHVPCYRALYDRHGVHPRDIRSLADLEKLPFASKSEMHAGPAQHVIADNVPFERLLPGSSSGSTGEPLRVWRTWHENAVQHVFRLRAERQLGVRPGDRQAHIHRLRAKNPRDRKRFGRALAALGIHRAQPFDVDPPELILERITAYRPDVIYALANIIVEVGRILTPAHKARLRPRFLISTSEVLTPAMRAEAEAAWGVPIWDYYGSYEAGFVAAQCREAGDLHVFDDSVIVEVLRDGRPAAEGERGELVVTSLHHHAMPFIRYRHADIATRGPATCACGRPFSKIGAIQGRMIDFFRFPGGRWVHPYDILNDLLGDAPDWVLRYQMIQEREDRVVVQLVPRSGTPAERVARFRRAAAGVVGPDVQLVAEVVERIDPGPNGKMRPSRSMIRSEYDVVDWKGSGYPRASPAVRGQPMPEHP